MILLFVIFHYSILGLLSKKMFNQFKMKYCVIIMARNIYSHYQFQRRRLEVEREVTLKNLAVKDLKKSFAAESSSAPVATVDELQQEISVCISFFQQLAAMGALFLSANTALNVDSSSTLHLMMCRKSWLKLKKKSIR